MKIFYLVSLIGLITISNLSSQITVTPALTAQQLVNVLTGGTGGSVTNITYTGHVNACGSFVTGATPSNLGISSGIILSTGNATGAVGANTSGSTLGTDLLKAGNSLLTTMALVQTYDAAVLQFDFVPTTNTISFRYVFGSEEYDEFVNDVYNDAFAFFLTGPNPAGGNYNNSNISLIPGTTQPVAINNLNNGNKPAGFPPTGPCEYCQYYVSNLNGTSIKYDGFTTPLTATVNVTPCATYTIKLAIADGYDGIYDSGVFIEQGSFTGINTPGIIVNSTPLCGGVPVTYSYSGTGTPQSWTFTGGTPATAIGVGPHTVTYATAGTYAVSSVVNAGCDMNVNSSVTITSAAPTSSSNSPICAGQTLNLSSSGGVSYSWSGPNGFTSTLQNPPITSATTAATGTYTVTVTTAGSCVSTSSVNVTVNNGVTPVSSSNGPICEGTSLNLNASGGTIFSWTGPNGFTSSQQNPTIASSTIAATGTYSVTISTAQGCSATSTTDVTIYPKPVIIPSSNSPICSGSNLTLNSSGGNSYSWTGPNSYTSIQQNPIIYSATTAATGTYTVTVTTTNNCTATSTINAIVNSAVTPQSSNNGPLCEGANLLLNSSGGASYSWSGPNGFISNLQNPNISSVSVSSSGTYSVIITSSQGCTATTTTDVIINPNPTISISSNSPICSGNSLILNASGGNAYNWSGPNGFTSVQQNPTIPNAQPINSGNYNLTVTNTANCTSMSSLANVVNSNPSILGTITNVLCFGENTGSIISSISGGTSPFSYNWSNGSTSQNISGVGAGVYSLNLVDVNNCTVSYTGTITQPMASLITFVSSTNVLCYGGNNGTLTLTVSGGTSPYGYSWSNGSTLQNIPTCIAGTYTVTVTDANLCKSTSSTTITQPNAPLTATYSNVNVLCYGESTGSISTIASGGTIPYSYIWSDGPNTPNLVNIPANSYNLTITDANLCTFNINTSISQPIAPLSVSLSQSANICYGQNTIINSSVIGGTAPYSYSWKDNSGVQFSTNINITVSPTITNSYTLVVTDNNGCVTSPVVSAVNVSPKINLSFNLSNVKCKGACDGSAVANITGGVSPYTYSWTSIGNTLNNICAGNYILTITDNWGCRKDTFYTITEPTALAYTTSSSPTNCKGMANGIARINVSGGTPSYSYNWSNGLSVVDSLVTIAGTYYVTVTDANSCKIITSITITEPTEVMIIPTSNKIICKGQSTIINASASGGTPPYTFNWWSQGSNPQTGNNINITPIMSVSYFVYAKDSKGCMSQNKTVSITVLPSISVDIDLSKTTICAGESVQLTANISGGNSGPYYCTLNNNEIVSFPHTINPNVSDTIIRYIVTVSDMCTVINGVDSINLKVLPLPIISINANPRYGCVPLKVQFNELTQHIGQTYNWNFNDLDFNNSNQKNPLHTFNYSGVYDISLSVTSLEGCINTVTLEDYIKVYAKPRALFNADPIVSSIIDPVIYFDNYSTSTFISLWDFNDGTNSFETSPRHRYNNIGSYNVKLIVEDENGCKDSSLLPVIIKDEHTFYAPTAFTPGTDNINDIFFVTGNAIDPNYFNLYIYDRWGEVVFYTDKFNKENPKEFGWDGKIKGKNNAEIGTYTWYVVYKTTNGQELQKSGPVSIIR